MPRLIAHVDMDAFYASVEQRDNPDLRGKPVAVGGSRERGVVAAASYEARKFGVRSAMPSVTARRQCPDLIFVKPRFEVYKAVSQQIREIFAEHTPIIEPLSLDEAYLDVTENLQNIPLARDVALAIRARIKEVTGLNASAGISYNKVSGEARLRPPQAEWTVRHRFYDIDDIVGRDSDRWAVDFGTALNENDAALYEAPFEIIRERVVPFRNDPEKCRSDEGRLKERYWEFQRPRPDLRRALVGKRRFIVTPESSEHRIFVFVQNKILLQGSLFAIVREDDTTFGILCSRIHEIWATAQGNRLGVGKSTPLQHKRYV
jgi:hypothetical protein